MAASASLSVARLEVAPGAQGTIELTVRNTGSVVDEFHIEVLGPARSFATVTPSVLPLFPGAEGKAAVTFAPTRDFGTPTGEIDVAVKVTSKEDPDGSAVEEAVVVVSGFDDTFAELVPRTIRGSRSAVTELAIDNRGNSRVQSTVEGIDADGVLRFEVEPPSVGIDPGAANFAKVRVIPLKRFWKGPDRTFPFKVSATSAAGTQTVDGLFVQKAMLPRWLVRLLLLLLLGIIALLALWKFAFKPLVRDEARQAAKQETNAAADQAANQAAKAVLGAGGGAPTTTAAGGGSPTTTAPGSGPGGGGAGAGAGAGAAGTGGDDGRGGISADKRIEVQAAPGETKSGSWTPAGKDEQFNLTDIVLQNPEGNTGLIRIKRGDDILLESALENFRDLDFHFVAPYVFKGKDLIVEVECKNPTGNCDAAATLTGFVKKAA